MFCLGGYASIFPFFWGKLYLISAAINSEYISLAIIIVLNSAIAVYYYMKLVIYMFLKDPNPVRADAGLYANQCVNTA